MYGLAVELPVDWVIRGWRAPDRVGHTYFTGGRMRYVHTTTLMATGLFLASCTQNPAAPTERAAIQADAVSWGPETPNFNLEVILRGQGFGLVKFRQPKDGDLIIYLDTWVRDLAPNTSYLLQRAVDTNVDGVCTSTGWLTLGKGMTPQAIVTDQNGTGRADLFRSVAALPVGSRFDIHFRVVEAASAAVVLESECYQYTVSL